MAGEIEPAGEQALSPRQQRVLQEQRIATAKNNALELSLTAIADDLQRRAADGSLAADLAGMKTSSILGQLTRITAAIKAVQVFAPTVMPMRDPTALKAQSATQLSPAQRELRRKEAEAIDAEIIPE